MGFYAANLRFNLQPIAMTEKIKTLAIAGAVSKSSFWIRYLLVFFQNLSSGGLLIIWPLRWLASASRRRAFTFFLIKR